MKPTLLLATLLTIAAAAIVPPPDIGIPAEPSPPPAADIPCGRAVDLAVAGARTVVLNALRGPDMPKLQDAVDAGVASFKRELRCGDGIGIPEENAASDGDDDAPEMDCSGRVDMAIAAGKAMLQRGFQLVGLPRGYDRAVEEGVKSFKTTLRCKQA